jgi:hypothetical protein
MRQSSQVCQTPASQCFAMRIAHSPIHRFYRLTNLGRICEREPLDGDIAYSVAAKKLAYRLILLNRVPQWRWWRVITMQGAWGMACSPAVLQTNVPDIATQRILDPPSGHLACDVSPLSEDVLLVLQTRGRQMANSSSCKRRSINTQRTM